MFQTVENKGLCSNCIYLSNCALHKNHTKIVWQCEEYDNKPFVNYKTDNKKILKQEESKKGIDNTNTTNEEDTITYKGLCVNCENRNICKKEIVQGGIWHCENYQ